MESGFSILMFCLSGGLLLWAAVLAISRNSGGIPRDYAVKKKNGKKYAVGFAKVLALTAMAPLAGGIVGLFDIAKGVGVLITVFVAALYIGTKDMEDDLEE